MKFGIGADVNADTGVEVEQDIEQPTGKAWLDLFGKLSLGVNNLAAEVKEIRQREQARLAHVPVNIPMTQGFPRFPGEAAAVTTVLDFGGPQPGREWIIRELIGVASPLASNATVASWYIGQNILGPAAGMLPPSMIRWQFASLPGFEKFTSDILRVMPNERLILGLTGIPASSTLSFTAIVLDQLQNDFDRRERV